MSPQGADKPDSPTTLLAHTGLYGSEATSAPLVNPIAQTSVYGDHAGYTTYGRRSQPNRVDVERAVAHLEQANRAVAFPSGMAAIYASLRAVDAEHVVFPANVYGGIYELVTREPARQRVTYEVVDYEDLASVEAAMGRGRALLWLECPSNPMLDVYDIEEMAELAHRAGGTVIVDSTLATPLGQQPLLWGADLVIHSISKYLAGHGDVIGGVAATNDLGYAEALSFYQQVAGLIPSPMDCWLTARGLRTLAVRFARQATSAFALAEQLQRTAEIQRVYYPACSDRGRELFAKGQLRSYCAVVSLELADTISPESFVQSVRLARPAASLGGVESTVSRPAVMSHRVPVADGVATVEKSLIRVSVGLEDVTDLIDDIKRALDQARR